MTAAETARDILTVESLDIFFNGRRRGEVVRAVENVSFAVRQGETFGVIGESGSGKSTLGRGIVGLTRLSGGRILHFGEDPRAFDRKTYRSHRQERQIIFQDPNAALDPRMSIVESVREPMDVARAGRPAERHARALAMLDRVALAPELAERYPHEISGGQKQRANIARALVLDPTLIVCDEVVAALDVSIQADILNLFADLQREFHLTYVFISHDLAVVAHIADRVAVMYFGKLVELGPAADIADTPLHPYTRALMSAEPEPAPSHRRTRERIVLEGEIPSPLDPPTGCRFHTRCPLATAECRAREPDWREIVPGRWVACHYADQTTAERGVTV